jgi:hypothetical protein
LLIAGRILCKHEVVGNFFLLVGSMEVRQQASCFPTLK